MKSWCFHWISLLYSALLLSKCRQSIIELISIITKVSTFVWNAPYLYKYRGRLVITVRYLYIRVRNNMSCFWYNFLKKLPDFSSLFWWSSSYALVHWLLDLWCQIFDSFYFPFLLSSQEEIQTTLHGKWDINDAIKMSNSNNRKTNIWIYAAVFADAVCVIIRIPKGNEIVYSSRWFYVDGRFFSLPHSFSNDFIWWAMSAKIVRHNRFVLFV